MNPLILAYVFAVVIFVAIDMIWLLWLGRPFYVAEIGGLMRTNPNLAAAVAFYLLYSVGVVYFAVNGAVQSGNASQALLQGAMLGLIAYGTYDLTNLAVINGFTLKIALIDLVWGTVLTAAVSWLVSRICLAIV